CMLRSCTDIYGYLCFSNDRRTTGIYCLSLHDALPIFEVSPLEMAQAYDAFANGGKRVTAYGISRIRTPQGRVIYQRASREAGPRSEEHTSELQSRENLVCRLLLEKKTDRNRYRKN